MTPFSARWDIDFQGRLSQTTLAQRVLGDIADRDDVERAVRVEAAVDGDAHAAAGALLGEEASRRLVCARRGDELALEHGGRVAAEIVTRDVEGDLERARMAAP